MTDLIFCSYCCKILENIEIKECISTIKIKQTLKYYGKSHCVKCPNTEFFLVRIIFCSVRIQENTVQKKLRFGHSSRSVIEIIYHPQLVQSKENITFISSISYESARTLYW